MCDATYALILSPGRKKGTGRGRTYAPDLHLWIVLGTRPGLLDATWCPHSGLRMSPPTGVPPIPIDGGDARRRIP